MKLNFKEIARWAAIAVFGGLGIWISIEGCYEVISSFNGNWVGAVGAVVELVWIVLFALSFFLGAYICFRRAYREFFYILGGYGALGVYLLLSYLLRHWHVLEFINSRMLRSPGMSMLGCLFGIICLLAPIYAAILVYRLCMRHARLPAARSSELPPSAATAIREP